MDDNTRILVVDDEQVVRDGCSRVLMGKGYEVLTAENGQAAMDLLAKETVDIILLDLKMPVMSGEEVLKKASSQYPNVAVIIITGHGTVDTAVECMKQGAYDFITKPFQIDQFLLTINRAAERRALEKKAQLYEEERLRNLYDLDLEKSRLKTIINCMPDGVMVTNRNLEVVLHNPALMRLLEIAEKVENPISVNRIIDNDPLRDTLKDIQARESAKNEFISQEIGTGKRVLRAISAPALGPDEKVVGTVTVLQDITAFKQLDEMKSDFLNMVAHELRSPLISIRQQNTVLLDGLVGPLEKKQETFVEKGVKKIDQLLDLINDLLDIAKIEAGKHIQHRVPTDIESLIRDTLSLLEPRAQGQGITLTSSCKNMKPVHADPRGLEEIFNNLVTNAINYSPEGGRINVTAQVLGEYMEIKVSDTGVGIVLSRKTPKDP